MHNWICSASASFIILISCVTLPEIKNDNFLIISTTSGYYSHHLGSSSEQGHV